MSGNVARLRKNIRVDPRQPAAPAVGMPRASSDLPPRTETPATLRDMAAHGRRLAHTVSDQKACKALTEFAEELEARATALDSPRRLQSRRSGRRDTVRPRPRSKLTTPAAQVVL